MRVLGLRPELADPIGPIEVGKHQDAEQLGAGCWADRHDGLLFLAEWYRPCESRWLPSRDLN